MAHRDALYSLIAQIACMLIALLAGRFLLKSRFAIWRVAFAGVFGAMFAHMVVDGQGAFLFVIYAPVIYVLAVLGRDDLK